MGEPNVPFVMSALGSPIAPATVVHVDGSHVGVRSAAFGAGVARVAVADYLPRAGDTVLVASGTDSSRYVIGVLAALREVKASLRTDDGASASIEPSEHGDVLAVRDASGRLVFELRGGASVVHAASEDLEIATQGRLRLRARRGVEIDGGDSVSLTSEGPVELRSERGEDASTVRLDAERTTLRSSLLDAELTEAAVKAKEARLVIGTIRTVAQRIRERAETVERSAGTIVERAKEMYRETEGLSQTRAGRIRLVAEQTFHALGERAVLKAHEDVKVKGKKIYLA
ncbi:MAG: DUF3540 domain-containing protein [Sandaracinaceae bacterium]